MRILFVAQSAAPDAGRVTSPIADAVEALLRHLGHDVARASLDDLGAQIAAGDPATPIVAVLVARASDAIDHVRRATTAHALAPAQLVAVTDADGPDAIATIAALLDAGAADHVAWPREAPLLRPKLRAVAERVEARSALSEAARAERELRTREERLRTLIDLATDAIFLKDRSGRYVLINPAGARLLGAEPDAIIGKKDDEIFAEATARDVVEHDLEAMRSRRPIHYEGTRIIGGEERLCATSKFAYVSPEGDLLGIAGITRDVTDLKRAEEAERRRTKQRLAHQAALLSLAQQEPEDFVRGLETILDVAAATLGAARVSFWSFREEPAAVLSAALRRGDAATWTHALDARARLVPRYFETLQENRAFVADDARALGGGELAATYLDPTGVRAFLDAPVWLHGSLAGVVCHEHVGAPRAWTAEEQDFVTSIGHMVSMALGARERDRAEQELRRTEARLRSLIEQLPDAIFVLREGLFFFVNDAGARYLGYAKPDEVIGRALEQVVHPEDRAEAAAIGGGSARPRTMRFVRQGGEVVSAEVAGIALTFDGEPATVAIARDLTERNRLEAQLLLADRMASVGTLAAGVAHEINNPLGYVLGNLNVLASALSGAGGDASLASDASDARQALLDAMHGAKRVRDIVADLQTFSRGDAARARGPADVLRVMDVSIRMAYTALRHRAQLVRDYASVPNVDASESKLGQVFLNLLVNAAQAMPERPIEQNEVKVRIFEQRGEVVIEVKDNGVGMPEAVRRRVFDPFFTTKAVGEGTGLGLSICHSIVTSVGGTITVESEPDVGTTFRVTLPEAREDAIEPRGASTPPPSGRRERVLVIDDEPMIGVMIRRLLAAHCDVLPLTSAREALRRLKAQERFDAILCDLMMPRMNGIEFFQELSALSPDLARRTGFLTGGAVTPQARKFLQEHPGRWLDKPVELGRLRAFVRTLAAPADAPEPPREPAPPPRAPLRPRG